MKLISVILAALALACVARAPATARADESIGGYWTALHHEQPATGHASPRNRHAFEAAVPAGAVPALIARHAARAGLAHWTEALIRIARIESGLRCSPGGNGGGLFQFSRGTRRAIGLRSPLSCEANAAAAMRYAARGIAMGARTSAQLGAFWNSGNPFTARHHLERAYRMARL